MSAVLSQLRAELSPLESALRPGREASAVLAAANGVCDARRAALLQLAVLMPPRPHLATQEAAEHALRLFIASVSGRHADWSELASCWPLMPVEGAQGWLPPPDLFLSLLQQLGARTQTPPAAFVPDSSSSSSSSSSTSSPASPHCEDFALKVRRVGRLLCAISACLRAR